MLALQVLLLIACACSVHGQLPTVHINDCGGTIVAGQNCTLVCSTSGVGSFTISYQWIKNNGTAQTRVGNNSNTLAFVSLQLSDAGRYTCRVTVGLEMYGYSEYINIKIPVPKSMYIMSNPTSPIRPIESAVTLNCIVELSPLVDVPVTVNVHLSDPTGSPLTTTTPSVSGSNHTTIAMISSFGRNQSGNYSCTATLTSDSLFLTNSRSLSAESYITVGVFLSFKKNVLANNSFVFLSEMGETYSNNSSHTKVQLTPPRSLQCITDRISCCNNNSYPQLQAGEWFFPDGTLVPTMNNSNFTLYRDRGSDGSVNLNKHSTSFGVAPPLGSYCCVIPDAGGENHTLCANIVFLNITDHGVLNIAGENYIIICRVDGGYHSTYRWSDENGNSIITDLSNGIYVHYIYSITLIRFFPFQQSHEGAYTCNATISEATISKSFHVSVNVPMISVKVSDEGVLPVTGLNFSLICDILGDYGHLHPNVSYLWTSSSSYATTNNNSLFFYSLHLSDAGEYTCQVNVASPYLNNNITAVASYSLTIEIPAPISIVMMTDKSNPVRPIGSAVTLSCTVELSPLVDVPVTVNILLSDRAGRTLATTTPSVSGSSKTYTTRVMISSFGREQSGGYTCTANTSSESAAISPFINGSQTGSETARITVGVYLSLKGIVYANNSLITITEIGEDDESLKCITDRIPCCASIPFRVGQWYFPNGSEVPVSALGTSFYRRRSDEGFVYLNRRASDITHPIGQFCCAVPDAVGVIQTLCIIIIPSVSVWMISDGATPTVGQKYSLICHVSEAENLDPVITYRWTKHNDTQTYYVVGTNSNILSFSSLRLSDAGSYTCEVTVNSRLLHDAINETSKQLELYIPVPQPVVSLVSDTPNPILSGSSPTLTCAVELSPAVDVPVSISTAWTGPDGSVLMSPAPPLMKSVTYYTSKAKLNYVESADSGIYNCTVSIRDKIRASVDKMITIGDMFQLRLMYTDDCRVWYKSGSNDFELYKCHIEEALIEAIESHCECHFPRANLLKASFSCASSPNLTTYRNTLIGTHNFNATQLIGFIQDWVTSAPQINIKDYSVWIDSSCPVAITSLKEPECGEVRQCPCANDPNVVKCMEHLENEKFAECINACI